MVPVDRAGLLLSELMGERVSSLSCTSGELGVE